MYANVLTRRENTGSGSRDVNEYEAMMYAVILQQKQTGLWGIVTFPEEDTTTRISYESQEDRQGIQNTWDRFLKVPNIDWQGIKSLTKTWNPTASRPALFTCMEPELPRSITLGEARELALEVLRTAKQHLKDERTEDGRFLASLLENEEDIRGI